MTVFAKSGQGASLFTADIYLRDKDKSSDDEDEEVAVDKDKLDAKPLSKRLTWNERTMIACTIIGVLLYFCCKRYCYPKPHDPHGANCLQRVIYGPGATNPEVILPSRKAKYDVGYDPIGTLDSQFSEAYTGTKTLKAW